MKLSLLTAFLFSIAGCAADHADHASTASANDTSVDLGTTLVTISGHVTVNGQGLDNALVAGNTIGVSIRLTSEPDGAATDFFSLPAGAATYSVQVPAGSYKIGVELTGSQILVPSGDHTLTSPSFLHDTTFDIDVPLVKFTSHITANGQPLANVTRLWFEDTTKGDSFTFEGAQVQALEPFVGYVVPGIYNVTAYTYGPGPDVADTAIPLAAALVIE